MNERDAVAGSGTDSSAQPCADAPPRGECPVCRRGELITISMKVHGAELGFTSCNGCEAKWWERDGKLLPFASVIDIVAEPSRH